jgi:hypothetical protein
MELLGYMGHMESPFLPFRAVVVAMQDRCLACARCTIGSEIILDAHNGATR